MKAIDKPSNPEVDKNMAKRYFDMTRFAYVIQNFWVIVCNVYNKMKHRLRNAVFLFIS